MPKEALGILDDEAAVPEARREALLQLRLDLEAKLAAFRTATEAHRSPPPHGPDWGDQTARLADTAASHLGIEIARMEYQDAFTRYMAASDRERERDNRLAQAAAERRTMEIAKSNRLASWAMVFFTIVIAVATAWQACHH